MSTPTHTTNRMDQLHRRRKRLVQQLEEAAASDAHRLMFELQLMARCTEALASDHDEYVAAAKRLDRRVSSYLGGLYINGDASCDLRLDYDTDNEIDLWSGLNDARPSRARITYFDRVSVELEGVIPQLEGLLSEVGRIVGAAEKQ